MRIAVVGAGVSGLVAARRLHADHEITLFEADHRLGGHAHTVTVDDGGRELHLDTGFLVFNRRDYPRFDRLLNELDVASHPTCMSFSVRDERTGVEYAGDSLAALFCQPRNLFRRDFRRMFRDLVRFYRTGGGAAARSPQDSTIEEWAHGEGFGEEFMDWHLLPLGSALWSAPPSAFRNYPARFVMDFLSRHDLMELNVKKRIVWRTVTGGSRRYVEALVAPFRDRIRSGAPVDAVRRTGAGVEVHVLGETVAFDHVLFACHGDDALALLRDASPEERRILGAARYQPNDTVLHTDTRMLPRSRRAWSSWNYHVRKDRDLATVTYDLNRLQGLDSAQRFGVTLNERDAVDPSRILHDEVYRHPQFSLDWIARREEQDRIQGVRNTWFCGAYFGNGFHEDGVRSAELVCDALRARAAESAGPETMRGGAAA